MGSGIDAQRFFGSVDADRDADRNHPGAGCDADWRRGAAGRGAWAPTDPQPVDRDLAVRAAGCGADRTAHRPGATDFAGGGTSQAPSYAGKRAVPLRVQVDHLGGPTDRQAITAHRDQLDRAAVVGTHQRQHRSALDRQRQHARRASLVTHPPPQPPISVLVHHLEPDRALRAYRVQPVRCAEPIRQPARPPRFLPLV